MKTFPMFLKMAGRQVIVLGGGEQAAQKTRLMLKTEAEICVVAPDLDPELQALADDGRIVWSREPVTTDLLRSAALVFSATGCAGAGAAHAALARDANALINVVDMPDLCEAMTPSIVDRDPLVVAIGTEGNAPVLARQVKSQIEVMLEPNLGRFVQFCGRMRPAVAQKVAQADRRSFWKWAFNDAPRRLFAAGSERRSIALFKAQVEAKGAETRIRGSLNFVEALAKDADLVTLRTCRLLQEADFIFYEAPHHDAVLELARRDAARQSYQFRPDCSGKMHRLFTRHADGNRSVVVLSSQPLAHRGWTGAPDGMQHVAPAAVG